MQKTQPYDAISASILYAAARYNVHGYVQQATTRSSAARISWPT
jgi:hypothetical protein